MHDLRLLGIVLAMALAHPSAVLAIVVTPNTSAMELALAVTGGLDTGLTVTGASLSGHTGFNMLEEPVTSSGTFTNFSGTYGIGPGIILSSGGVEDYGDGPNTSFNFTTAYGVPATPEQEDLLFPISGMPLHFDVTQLDITFDVDAGTDSVFFNVTFGSEEFDDFVGSIIDAFGLYLNGINIAFIDGLPINIDHPNMGFHPGTELNGILGGSTGPLGPLVHTFSGAVTPGSTDNVLTFIIADTLDDVLDSTVYISQLGGVDPGQPRPDAAIPEPSTAILAALCLVAVVMSTRRRHAA
ncbi:MAG: choice-of-anchor L domain-containing protein [Phycisphaeraceae bacterium]|nr:choice-of-anchor L domain-containing protein [Phycisphaeraceae bacterium]